MKKNTCIPILMRIRSRNFLNEKFVRKNLPTAAN